jgi:hypothetical protein
VAHADKQARKAADAACLPLHSQRQWPRAQPATRKRIMSKEWPLWEVFIRSQHGLAHKHVGSLHARWRDGHQQCARRLHAPQ